MRASQLSPTKIRSTLSVPPLFAADEIVPVALDTGA